MQLKQIILHENSDYENLAEKIDFNPSLILVFGGTNFFSDTKYYDFFKDNFPNSILAGCSTAGEINKDGVENNSCIVTAIAFDSTEVLISESECSSMEDSYRSGTELSLPICHEKLKNVLLIGKGLNINGSALIEGLQDGLSSEIAITGGLAGDNGNFSKTYVLSSTGISADKVIAIGFAGNNLQVSHGSYGGWSPFGPIRKITKAKDNILYELDGKSALGIYKDYLGDYAKDLPASGLLFPFEMLSDSRESEGLIRTILGVNEDDGSVTLAGDVSTDGYLRLMHANTDDLIEGARESARQTMSLINDTSSISLGILISCVGRKLVMGDEADEEVSTVVEALGKNTTITGFYSYGEISPFSTNTDCKLHNQTMTVTYITETN